MRKHHFSSFLLIAALTWAGVTASLLAQEPVSSQTGLDPFLQLPLYGNPTLNSNFDHEFPNYAQNDIFTLHSGQQWTDPPDPVSSSECTPGTNCYDGHDGIDYSLSYKRVIAAAPGNVIEAGWDVDECYDIGNPECDFGLRVWIQHNNQYKTLYGHLSSISIEQFNSVETEQPIATSGNTGQSFGAHLHFGVTNDNDVVVNPYGWTGKQADPWEEQNPQAISWCMWLNAQTGCTPPVVNPPIEYQTVVVDDLSPYFSKGCSSGSSCWGLALKGYNGQSWFTNLVQLGDWARWRPLLTYSAEYDLYVHVPSFGNSRTYEARYSVKYANDVNNHVIVTQNDTSGADRWYFIGRYTFNIGGAGYVQVVDTLPPNSTPYNQLLVDAVKFVRVSQPIYTPTPTRTLTPTPSGTPTRTPSVTFTPSRTPTPIPTDQCPQQAVELPCTPTPTRTPTQTPTRTPSRTPSPIPTDQCPQQTVQFPCTPTPTRTPTTVAVTATPTYTPIPPIHTPTWTPIPTDQCPQAACTPTPTATRTPSRTPTRTPTDDCSDGCNHPILSTGTPTLK